MQAQDRQMVSLRHSLLGVCVGQNRPAGSVQWGVVVGVVKVPVGVNHEFQRCVTKTREALFQPGSCGRKKGINDELAIRSVEHHSVRAQKPSSTSPFQF